MAVASHAAGAAVRTVSPLARILSDLQTRWRLARAYRAEYNRTLDELASLTDRERADIGISRLTIRELAHEHAAMKTGFAR